MDVQRHEPQLPELKDLADHIGDFIQYWGFKRVHGRIWIHLFLSKVPLDAFDLRQRLGISKALVSLSVRDLIHYSVIRECGKSDRGTILYEANPVMKEAISNVLRSREKKMLASIQSTHQQIASLSEDQIAGLNISRERLDSLGEVIQGAHHALECLLACQELDGEVWKNFLGLSNSRT